MVIEDWTVFQDGSLINNISLNMTPSIMMKYMKKANDGVYDAAADDTGTCHAMGEARFLVAKAFFVAGEIVLHLYARICGSDYTPVLGEHQRQGVVKKRNTMTLTQGPFPGSLLGLLKEKYP